jgi:hypothetical protein
MRGVGLSGLLVSMALGTGLSLAVTGVYSQVQQDAAREAELARMRDAARYLSTLLRRELSMVGLLGTAIGLPAPPAAAVGIDCAAGNWALNADQPLDLVDDAGLPLVTRGGTNLTCLPAVDADVGVVPDTDVLLIKRTAADPTLDDGRFAPQVLRAEDSQWYLRERLPGPLLEWAYVGEGGRFPAPDRIPGSGVSYSEYYARLYYLRAWSVEPGDGIPSFCREQLAGNRMISECLVEGVEQFQLEFGIDTDGDGVADRVTSLPTAAELALAVRARYYLLLRSLFPLEGPSAGRSFVVAGVRTPAHEDRFHRRLVSGVVVLPNRAARPAP